MTTLLITIIPSLFIVSFFVISDRFPEPTKEIIKIFFYGILICFPAFYLNSALSDVYANTEISDHLKECPAIKETCPKCELKFYKSDFEIHNCLESLKLRLKE